MGVVCSCSFINMTSTPNGPHHSSRTSHPAHQSNDKIKQWELMTHTNTQMAPSSECVGNYDIHIPICTNGFTVCVCVCVPVCRGRFMEWWILWRTTFQRCWIGVTNSPISKRNPVGVYSIQVEWLQNFVLLYVVSHSVVEKFMLTGVKLQSWFIFQRSWQIVLLISESHPKDWHAKPGGSNSGWVQI